MTLNIPRQLLLTSLLLALVLALFQWIDIDVMVQDHFYDASIPDRELRWVVDLRDETLALIFHAKHATNIYCPAQLDIYGWRYPHVKTFDPYPEGFTPLSRGLCYPAAHASAGFALMSLFFLFTRRKHKLAGLAAGFTLGWVMGGYQMLKGAHFLSHTLVTMCASWLIILLCYAVVKKTMRGTYA